MSYKWVKYGGIQYDVVHTDSNNSSNSYKDKDRKGSFSVQNSGGIVKWSPVHHQMRPGYIAK